MVSGVIGRNSRYVLTPVAEVHTSVFGLVKVKAPTRMEAGVMEMRRIHSHVMWKPVQVIFLTIYTATFDTNIQFLKISGCQQASWYTAYYI